MENRAILIDFGKTEAVLSLNEQIPGEQYVQGARIKTYIIEVKKTTKGPLEILVSRTHPGLLKRLFELEVPEIHDGIVEIKSVSREAGSRSKLQFILRMKMLIRLVHVWVRKGCVYKILCKN